VIETLAHHTTLGLGGPAAAWVETDSESSLLEALADCAEDDHLILGGGSNLLVADDGFPGTVIKVMSQGLEMRPDGDDVILSVQAGHEWNLLVEEAIRADLAGIECLVGIPGTVGGVPIQNVGAYGQCARQTLFSVRAYDCLDGEIVTLANRECNLSYRNSVFKQNLGRYVVLMVEFKLETGGLAKPIADKALAQSLGVPLGTRLPLGEVRDAVLALRRERGMLIDPSDPDTRSAGSFFLNPSIDAETLEAIMRSYPPAADEVKGLPHREIGGDRFRVSAAWMIAHAGFKRGYGTRDGIAISGKHVLALTNRGSGSATQAVSLAHEIARGVGEKFQVELIPEPVFVGHSWLDATD
jgi:UDP-N-acetylmuramate dehydrogenase